MITYNKSTKCESRNKLNGIETRIGRDNEMITYNKNIHCKL